MEIKSDVDQNQKPYWPPGAKCRCKKQTKYIQPAIPRSFKPIAEYKKEGDPLSNDTIYKKSYKPFDLDDLSKTKVLPIRPANTLMSAGDFQSDTTNKMSYGRWDGYQRSKKIPPKDHCLLGVGPVQEMTTNRHDYTPKYLNERTQSFKPPSWLGLSDKAMERSTTNNLSYAWPDQFEPTMSFRPEKRYIRPENKMESDSTQKMSYKPWDPSALRREKFPWQEKGKYNPPTVPMIGETIYNNSYFEPGRFEEMPACGNCYCLTIGECFDSEGNPPKAHEYTVCPIGYDPIRDGPRTPVTTT